MGFLSRSSKKDKKKNKDNVIYVIRSSFDSSELIDMNESRDGTQENYSEDGPEHDDNYYEEKISEDNSEIPETISGPADGGDENNSNDEIVFSNSDNLKEIKDDSQDSSASEVPNNGPTSENPNEQTCESLFGENNNMAYEEFMIKINRCLDPRLREAYELKEISNKFNTKSEKIDIRLRKVIGSLDAKNNELRDKLNEKESMNNDLSAKLLTANTKIEQLSDLLSKAEDLAERRLKDLERNNRIYEEEKLKVADKTKKDILSKVLTGYENLERSLNHEIPDISQKTEKLSKDILEENTIDIVELKEFLNELNNYFKNQNTFREAIVGTNNSFRELFEDENITEIPTVNEKPDYYKHEQIGSRHSDDVEEGHIVEEVQKGYMMGDNVLKPAMVIVCKKERDLDG